MSLNYFYAKNSPMLTIDESIYKNLARKLLLCISDSYYFNGSLEYDTEELHSTLRVTLVIYREPLLDPADPSNASTRIIGIVPVWWEYETFLESGQAANDFSWSELHDYFALK